MEKSQISNLYMKWHRFYKKDRCLYLRHYGYHNDKVNKNMSVTVDVVLFVSRLLSLISTVVKLPRDVKVFIILHYFKSIILVTGCYNHEFLEVKLCVYVSKFSVITNSYVR